MASNEKIHPLQEALDGYRRHLGFHRGMVTYHADEAARAAEDINRIKRLAYRDRIEIQ